MQAMSVEWWSTAHTPRLVEWRIHRFTAIGARDTICQTLPVGSIPASTYSWNQRIRNIKNDTRKAKASGTVERAPERGTMDGDRDRPLSCASP